MNRDQDYPKKGDKLFVPDKDCINWFSTTENSFFKYSEGYRSAGTILYARIKEIEYEKIFLAYPMIFCYRQFIELRLKELLFFGSKLFSSVNTYHPTHNLTELFKQFENEMFPCLGCPSDIDKLSATKLLILELAQLDNASMSFRYPLQKNGQSSINKSNFDIEHFKIIMDRISNFLDSMLEYLNISQEYDAEMQAEYNAAMEQAMAW